MEFTEYVRTRGPALQRLGYLLAGEAHLGEDLVQTALMKAYRIEPGGGFSARSAPPRSSAARTCRTTAWWTSPCGSASAASC